MSLVFASGLGLVGDASLSRRAKALRLLLKDALDESGRVWFLLLQSAAAQVVELVLGGLILVEGRHVLETRALGRVDGWREQTAALVICAG